MRLDHSPPEGPIYYTPQHPSPHPHVHTTSSSAPQPFTKSFITSAKMYTPSLGSSAGNSYSSSSSNSLYRTSTKASSIATQSTLDNGPQSPKLRYGGRGGAGSRPRTYAPIVKDDQLGRVTSANVPQLQASSSNFKAAWLRRTASSDAATDIPTLTTPVPSVPAIPVSALAGRRGTINMPAPLILREPPSRPVPEIQTPPLSAASTATTSTTTTTDSQFPLTPRSPYFYFDDPFDSPGVASESPLPSPLPSSTVSGSMSRSLRRLASRTQIFFSKDLFLKAPKMSQTPTSPTFATSPTFQPSPSPTPLASSSRTSVVTSEWFDTPEPATPPEPPVSRVDPDLAPPLTDDFPRRDRSPSEATVKPQRRKKKRREPRVQGDWNRNDMGEVIVGLRMLK
ncbi:hypothetical protein DFH09DRAFT_1186438 [Mycena vulgaris]|nr:hypothetical protein DFH09DRAFT_1186438 [Mycena vulgaris]